jgi:hypothetical protein
LDGCSAIETVFIDIDFGAFKFYYGPDLRLFTRAEDTDSSVCMASIDKVFLLKVPVFLIVCEKGVAKRIAEDFLAELSFNIGFFHLVEFAAGFDVGPLADYFVCVVLTGAFEALVGCFLLQQGRQEQRMSASVFAITCLLIGFQK